MHALKRLMKLKRLVDWRLSWWYLAALKPVYYVNAASALPLLMAAGVL